MLIVSFTNATKTLASVQHYWFFIFPAFLVTIKIISCQTVFVKLNLLAGIFIPDRISLLWWLAPCQWVKVSILTCGSQDFISIQKTKEKLSPQMLQIHGTILAEKIFVNESFRTCHLWFICRQFWEHCNKSIQFALISRLGKTFLRQTLAPSIKFLISPKVRAVS